MRKVLYQLSDHFTLILFTVAIILIFLLLTYSQKIVHDLRSESRNIIEFYARVHSQAALQEDVTLVNFLFEEIIKRTNFPIILTDQEKNPDTWVGIHLDYNDKSIETLEEVKRMVQKLEKESEPVPITYNDPFLRRFKPDNQAGLVPLRGNRSYQPLYPCRFFGISQY